MTKFSDVDRMMMAYNAPVESDGLTLENFEDVNRILAELADDGTIEPMAEPIDCADCDPWDYAEVTKLFDEMYPEPIDSDDLVW